VISLAALFSESRANRLVDSKKEQVRWKGDQYRVGDYIALHT
jgi:hypothetical protein